MLRDDGIDDMKYSEQAELLKSNLKEFDEDEFKRWERENHVIGSVDLLKYILSKGD